MDKECDCGDEMKLVWYCIGCDEKKSLDLQGMVEYWLEHYEGLEHLTEGGTVAPETWYTINAILRRSFEMFKKNQTENEQDDNIPDNSLKKKVKK